MILVSFRTLQWS